jgi:hypothetical protein
VIVHDLDAFRSGLGSAEADPPLPVDPDAVLPGAITCQLLRPVAGDTRRSPGVSAASSIASLRQATRCVVVSSLRDRSRRQITSVSLSLKDLSTLRDNAMRY